MKRFKKIAMLLGVAMAISAVPTIAVGQSDTKTTTEAESTKKKIVFRIAQWQVKHVHDAAKADELMASLKKVGCEVATENHNGHIDLKYRCANWTPITVENDNYATQWSNWLIGQGAETVLVEPAETPGMEIVRFQMPGWNNTHLNDQAQANELARMLKMIGCEAEVAAHDGHYDVRYKTGGWKTIACHNHDAAHAWQDWLNKIGFETQHTH